MSGLFRTAAGSSSSTRVTTTAAPATAAPATAAPATATIAAAVATALALLATAAIALSPGSATAAAPGAELVYGLTGDDQLVSFRADAPGALLATLAITGTDGADVLGIDQRPDTGELLALARKGQSVTVFTVDPDTGTATRLVDVDRPLPEERLTADVDPVTDRLRIVVDGKQSLSVDLGTGATRVDPDLTYAAGDPAAGQAPNIAAIGHSGNRSGSQGSLLAGLDLTRATTVYGGRTDGVLRTLGPLGVEGVTAAALDVAESSSAYALLTTSAGTGFYGINGETGEAVSRGALPLVVQDLAVADPVVTAPRFSVYEGQLASMTVLRRGDAADPLTVDLELKDGFAGTAGSDAPPTRMTVHFAAGERSRSVDVVTTQDDYTEGGEGLSIALSNPSVGTVGRLGVLGIFDDSPPNGAENGRAYGLLPATEGLPDALLSFDVNNRGAVGEEVAVRGTTEPLVGIDVRPKTGVLYGVGAPGNGRPGVLYAIGPDGQATRVGALPALRGEHFGLDADPVADVLALVSDTGQRLRIDYATAATTVAPAPVYASDDPGAGTAPMLTALGYTGSTSGTPTVTTQYGIDIGRDVLVRRDGDLLRTVGPVGDTQASAGLDLTASGDSAFAILTRPDGPVLARIDLANGRTFVLGQLAAGSGGRRVMDLALISTAPSTMPPPPAPSPAPSPSGSASATPTAGTSAPPAASPTGSASPSPSTSRSPSPSPSATAAPSGRFFPLRPARILDTRRAPNTAVTAGTDRRVQVTGQGGVPTSGVGALILNVTVTLGSERGDLQVYPTGQRPEARTSNLNFAAGQTVPVQVQTGVGTGGAVQVSVNTGSADVIVDVLGWYGDGSSADRGEGFTPLAPQRLLDTRAAGNSPVREGADTVVQVTGRVGVPADATAVAVNATLLGTPGNADLQVFPTGDRPAQRTSNINVGRGDTRANAVVTELGSGGRLSLSISRASASVVLDVVGYYSPGSGGRFVPVQPQRILDTRTSADRPAVAASRTIAVRGRGGVPAEASAAVLSVTATGAGQSLDLQLFPTDQRPRQRTSTLNLRPGEAVANLSATTLAADGSITASASRSAVQVILDVMGYFTG